MQTANVLLSIGGHHGNTVPKFGVTAAEIAVLRAIHGDEAVKDVEPGRDVKRSHSQERARLLDTYGGAKDESGNHIVAGMFPGVAARVHETLAELDLPEDFYKATGRMTAASDAIRHDGPTVSEWVAAGYLAENYPPTGYASKSTQEEIDDAITRQQAARNAMAEKLGGEAQAEDAGEDGIDDMTDDVAEQDDAGKGPDNLFA